MDNSVRDAAHYLREHHREIASACVRGRLAQQRGENVMRHERLAMAILEASQSGDDAQLIELAAQWKRG